MQPRPADERLLARDSIHVQPRPSPPDRRQLLHAAIRGLNRWPGACCGCAILSAHRKARRSLLDATPTPCSSNPSRQLRILRTRSAHHCDIRRKISQTDLKPLLNAAHARQQSARGSSAARLESVFLPCSRVNAWQVQASAPYEFGVKASIVTTNARAPGGQFVLHAKALRAIPTTFNNSGLGEGDSQHAPRKRIIPLTHSFAWHHRAALSPQAGRGRSINARRRFLTQ